VKDEKNGAPDELERSEFIGAEEEQGSGRSFAKAKRMAEVPRAKAIG